MYQNSYLENQLLLPDDLQLSDRETVEQIVENPYLQYFISILRRFRINHRSVPPNRGRIGRRRVKPFWLLLNNVVSGKVIRRAGNQIFLATLISV
jgi:hypothetical protein